MFCGLTDFSCSSVEISAPPSQFYSYCCYSFIVQQRFYQPMGCVFDIPIVSLFISDLFIGLHATIPFVYISFILIAFLGMYVKKINIVSVLLSSTIFFWSATLVFGSCIILSVLRDLFNAIVWLCHSLSIQFW